MYTPEAVRAVIEERRREAVQIERQAQAEKAMRQGAAPRSDLSRSQRPGRPLLSLVARAFRAASAS